MSDMITTLHLAAEVPGEYMGRNSNFSGKGFAENTNVKAMPEAEFNEWVEDVKATAEPLTEEHFDELLRTRPSWAINIQWNSLGVFAAT